MVDTDAAWERIAQNDPYWGVLSTDDFLGNVLEGEVKERFFRSGQEHIDHVLEVLRSHVAPGFMPRSALDYGCGVGRLLLPLANICDRVVGIDVSTTMLGRASENLASEGLGDVELRRPSELDSIPRVQLVHSVLVLQHMNPRRGMATLAALVDLLEPGGCGAVQFHLRGAGSPVVRLVRSLRARSDAVNRAIVSMGRRPAREALVLMHEYDSTEVLRCLAAGGAPGVFLETRALPDGDTNVIMYFRKAAS